MDFEAKFFRFRDIVSHIFRKIPIRNKEENDNKNIAQRSIGANVLLAQRSIGADFLRTNNIHIISVFTFVSTGPTGHGLQPTR